MKYKVYSSSYETISAGSNITLSIAISGFYDFNLKHIRVFTPDYTKKLLIEIQDTSMNENWQNTPYHISAITRENVIIPFKRLLKRNSEITVKLYNNDTSNVDVQVMLLGEELKK